MANEGSRSDVQVFIVEAMIRMWLSFWKHGPQGRCLEMMGTPQGCLVENDYLCGHCTWEEPVQFGNSLTIVRRLI